MPFFGLCQNDELLKTLLEVFEANIMSVPEERVRPLKVLARLHDKLTFIGELTSLLKGKQDVDVTKSVSQVADISGKRSREVSSEIGLHILDGFLRGFGLPSAAITE